MGGRFLWARINNFMENNLAALLSKNNVGEQEAIEGYYLALTCSNLPAALVADLREIISDEMNHSAKLSAWATKLTEIYPAKD